MVRISHILSELKVSRCYFDWDVVVQSINDIIKMTLTHVIVVKFKYRLGIKKILKYKCGEFVIVSNSKKCPARMLLLLVRILIVQFLFYSLSKP